MVFYESSKVYSTYNLHCVPSGHILGKKLPKLWNSLHNSKNVFKIIYYNMKKKTFDL